MSADLPEATPPGVEQGSFASRIVVALVFAALFGWFLFAAVSNLIALPPLYVAQGVAEYTPWTALVLGVASPIVFFAGALLWGRGRSLVTRVLLLAAGLGATGATALTLYLF